MSKDPSNMSMSKRSAVKSLFAAFEILKNNGGEIQRKLLIEEMARRIKFEPWELERYESNGQLKWLTIFLFYSIDCMKAGWITKNKGLWFLTPEGERAVELGPLKLLELANKAYRIWKSNEVKGSIKESTEKDLDISDEQVRSVATVSFAFNIKIATGVAN